jgi:alpha-galactosidase
MAFRITFIGAGSIGFTRKLVADLLAVPEFADVEFAFTDIKRRNLSMVAELCRGDIAANGLKATLLATPDRREALRGARYVFNVVRIGGLEGFTQDVEIPLRYGIDQCVGDTLCAGGIMYAQRGIPALLDFCRDIREVAEPGCLLLNYANPMAMMVWAATKAGGVRAVGLCHGVQNGHRDIALAFGLPREEIDIVCAGINHQTWYLKIGHQGRDLLPRLLEAFERHPVLSQTEKVRMDVMRRFGYFSTESNGHLSEYVSWYRKRPEEIRNWIDLRHWIHGETGGYLRVCTEGRNWFEAEFGARGRPREPLIFSLQNRTVEHGSYILEALETGRTYRGHFNTLNRGIIPNLPPDCIIEAPGYVDRNGLFVPVVGDLPLGCAAVCNSSVSVQRLAVEAALTGDDQLLRQAFLMDPLVGAVCNPPEVWQMVDEMLVAGAKWLPQYKTAISQARKRLSREPRLPLRSSNGAARKAVRTAEELARIQGNPRQGH